MENVGDSDQYTSLAHSNSYSKCSENRDSGHLVSRRFPYPALPARPEISEGDDMELCE